MSAAARWLERGRPEPEITSARVLFAEDFEAEIAEIVEPEVIAPHFTLEEMELARKLARAEGIALGRAEAEGAAAEQVRGAMARVMPAIDAMAARLAENAEEIAEKLAGVLLATLAAALPELCRRHGAAEARALLASILPGLTQEPQVELRAHPAVLGALAATAQALRSGRMPQILAEADEQLSPGDIELHWRDGRAVRRVEKICGDIEQILGVHGLSGALAVAGFTSARNEREAEHAE